MNKIKKRILSMATSLCLALVAVSAFFCHGNTDQKVLAEEPLATPVVQETTPDHTFTFGEEMAGKSFVFYGDSITERCGLKFFDKDYIQFLQEEYGFYAHNAAKSGATITTFGSYTNNLVTQLNNTESIYRDADYVSIFMGTNDFGNIRPLGTMQSTGTDTVYGSLKAALNRIITANPDVKIMLSTPLWRGDGNYTDFDSKNAEGANGYTLADLREVVKSVGQAYGCKVVDMTQVFDASNTSEYMNPDRLHVYTAGYRKIADTMKA